MSTMSEDLSPAKAPAETSKVSSAPSPAALLSEAGPPTTLGHFISNRLVEVGCTTAFSVPGDYNLVLLDNMLLNKELKMVWTCNELNAGYAADGYARAKGVGCCVVTFCVGGFSVINAVAGAYSEDLPLLVISGGPNSNDFASNRVLHHTTGIAADLDQQLRAFQEVTCCQVRIQHLEYAPALVDQAISQCLLHSKPAYIEVCCNLPGITAPCFTNPLVPYVLATKHTNKTSLEAAVQESVKHLKSAVKPVIVVGPRCRPGHVRSALLRLAEASGYCVAVLPDAKGMFPESHERFIGTYWGAVSSPCVCETVEASDVVLLVGGVMTDYTSVGYSLLLSRDKVVKVDTNRVSVRGGKSFGCINIGDFVAALAEAVPYNDTAHVNLTRMYVPPAQPVANGPSAELRTNMMFSMVQARLSGDMALVAEVGDSWFNSQKLKLPEGAGYELQMRYGSIGWSVGATLGYALGTAGSKRVLALIGDGSFQMTAQEVSTMMRYGTSPIIILINNGGYTIEVEIHDGPYNVIKNWDYVGAVKAWHNGQGKLWTARAKTEGEFEKALDTALSRPDDLCFIEVVIHRDDCSRELLEWGTRVASANSRPPNPQ